MKIKLIFIFILLLTVACTNKKVEIKNGKKGLLKTTYHLELTATKEMSLDSITAPKVQYSQIYTDSDGKRYFTFLNDYNNSIYFYDYTTLKFTKAIQFEKGTKGIINPKGFYIKNMDSIFVYNKPLVEIVLANHRGEILKRISLNNNGIQKDWSLLYPQYYLETVNPFMEVSGKLLLTGQYFGSLTESMIPKFKFNAQIDLKTCKVSFRHTYPEQLYGFGYNWEGGAFTGIFPELHPDGDKLIYSFPVSHDVYIVGINSDIYQQVYAGSNFAGTIHSIDGYSRKTDGEKSVAHYIKEDLYSAIRFDKYRKVYYRFFLRGIPNASITSTMEDKPVSVIIMDKDFNYLGEKVIGTGRNWYWQNSFVTQEGLNIESLEKDRDEKHLILRIFTIKKIKK
jgi:hypothetical protein